SGTGTGVRALYPRLPDALAQRQGGVALGVSPRLHHLLGLDALALGLLPLRRQLRRGARFLAGTVPRPAHQRPAGEVQLLAQPVASALTSSGRARCTCATRRPRASSA